MSKITTTYLPPEFNKTPCVGRCSTVYGDPVCRGCKRFMDEVLYWNQWDLNHRYQVWQRLDQLAQQILPNFCFEPDANALQAFLKTNGIRYPKHLSHWSWALQCIENFPSSRHPVPLALAEAGLALKPVQRHLKSIKDLQLALQQSIYALAIALHERRHQVMG